MARNQYNTAKDIILDTVYRLSIGRCKDPQLPMRQQNNLAYLAENKLIDWTLIDIAFLNFNLLIQYIARLITANSVFYVVINKHMLVKDGSGVYAQPYINRRTQFNKRVRVHKDLYEILPSFFEHNVMNRMGIYEHVAMTMAKRDNVAPIVMTNLETERMMLAKNAAAKKIPANNMRAIMYDFEYVFMIDTQFAFFDHLMMMRYEDQLRYRRVDGVEMGTYSAINPRNGKSCLICVKSNAPIFTYKCAIPGFKISIKSIIAAYGGSDRVNSVPYFNM